ARTWTVPAGRFQAIRGVGGAARWQRGGHRVAARQRSSKRGVWRLEERSERGSQRSTLAGRLRSRRVPGESLSGSGPPGGAEARWPGSVVQAGEVEAADDVLRRRVRSGRSSGWLGASRSTVGEFDSVTTPSVSSAAAPATAASSALLVGGLTSNASTPIR